MNGCWSSAEASLSFVVINVSKVRGCESAWSSDSGALVVAEIESKLDELCGSIKCHSSAK